MTTATTLRSRHLLGIADLDPSEIELVLETSVAMKEIGTRPIKKVPTMRGRTVINLFFEPSTRTRMSFELAEKRRPELLALVRRPELFDEVAVLEGFEPEHTRGVYRHPPRSALQVGAQGAGAR